MLLSDLKKAVHNQMSANLNELQQRCKEEWDKMSPLTCERLIKSSRKHPLSVMAVKLFKFFHFGFLFHDGICSVWLNLDHFY